jgi:hypothetical protein
MKTLRNLAILGCLVVAGCQTPLRPATDFDPGVDFGKYQTFSWIDPNPLVVAATQRPFSPLVEQRLMRDTKAGLIKRGLSFVDDPLQADLVVAFTVGTREGIRITSYPNNSFTRGPTGRRSHMWRDYWSGSTVRTRQYTEGQLAIDLFDVAEARPVWHGTVSRRITSRDQAEPDTVIEQVVDAILAQFPPG